ncbi:MAG: YicC/YloC family endoribonuclease [Spirochaetota bacterium]
MESMTGYAFIEDSTEQFQFTMELKTLNSKYQEVYVNVPRILRYEENEMGAILKQNFARGKVEMTLEICEWIEPREVQINTELLIRYNRALSDAEELMRSAKQFTLDPLLSLDGVLVKERASVTDKSRMKIYQVLNQAVKCAMQLRLKEGRSVMKDMSVSLKAIAENLSRIKKMSAFHSREQFQKLQKRLQEAGAATVDDTRLYTEVALLADKLDINEETSRLKNHIDHFKTLMKTAAPLGKQLDFLSQEMFREINTIASKSNSSDISHLVVDVKNNIDKIREQCRNIV